MTWIEGIAAFFGLLSVIFTVRRSLWCWPTGLVMVSLYIVIFYDAKLYSDMLLQCVYVGLQIYGWWHWSRVREAHGEVIVEVLGRHQRFLWLGVLVVGTAALGTGMGRLTDAALPFWDASTTMMSLVAQWLMGRKKLESWVLWIAVDVLSIGIYWQRGLYITMGLYAVFLVLASVGLWKWRADRIRQVGA